MLDCISPTLTALMLLLLLGGVHLVFGLLILLWGGGAYFVPMGDFLLQFMRDFVLTSLISPGEFLFARH
jgi:hypothetical protein